MQNSPREQSAILLTVIKLPFVFKTFVLSIFEWSLKTGFTVHSGISFLILGRKVFKFYVSSKKNINLLLVTLNRENLFCLFDSLSPSQQFFASRDGSSWVESILSIE